ncbi:Radical SAM domain protein [Candidatus Sulfotelmatobacter kueseliae]|uniref:Radical SAM domain protein n=1 Tax=Candidatus Sulfotelmatobacter kueseliae TaxID=2042962 RepID=A0A2U3L5M3_9BACT|nr:Radical SAM domain protein [Candidatus Sulfotelmatobacter kueseliae]
MPHEFQSRASVRQKATGEAEVENSVREQEVGLLSCPLDRRSFLKCAVASGAALNLSALAPPLAAFPAAPVPQKQDDAQFTIEAKFYQKLENKKIKCKLCPRECNIGDRETGYCGVRENHGGTYYSLVHSRVCAAHIDPIEKKPLFHYLPGTLAFSIATAGCNVNCKFCQNWDISQARPEQVPAQYAPPKLVADLAKQRGCPTIAYTYSEPVVFSEYLMDVADAGHEAGVRSVVVSNGYMQEEALKTAYGKMDAVKIDLKAFSESYYKDVVTGELKPVLDSLVTLRKMGKWTEMVYLVVPTLNDSDGEFRGLARWVKANLGQDVPLHFTQFHPEYLLKNLPITPVPTLERAKAIADAEGLHYVYIGNVPGHPAENTYCPKCRRIVVERVGLTAKQMLISKGKCPFCGQPIPGIWHA